LNAARSNPQALSLLKKFLKQPVNLSSQALEFGSQMNPLVVSSRKPIAYLTQEKNFSIEEAKNLLASRFNIYNEKKSIPAICHTPTKTFLWQGLSSTELDLYPIEGGPSDCFLLIPTQLRTPDSEMLLSKSRWRFSLDNGIAPAYLDSYPVRVTLNIDNSDRPLELKNIQWTHEITTPRTKNRILCFKLTLPGGVKLFIASYLLKGGLHVGKPNLPKYVTLDIHRIGNDMLKKL
jgi:hypothetical protein